MTITLTRPLTVPTWCTFAYCCDVRCQNHAPHESQISESN